MKFPSAKFRPAAQTDGSARTSFTLSDLLIASCWHANFILQRYHAIKRTKSDDRTDVNVVYICAQGQREGQKVWRMSMQLFGCVCFHLSAPLVPEYSCSSSAPLRSEREAGTWQSTPATEKQGINLSHQIQTFVFTAYRSPRSKY